MKYFIELKKEDDINLIQTGRQYQIIVNNSELSIVFSKEILEKIISDYKSISDQQNEEAKTINLYDNFLTPVENIPIDIGEMHNKGSISERYFIKEEEKTKAINKFDLLNKIITDIIKLECDFITVSSSIAAILSESFEFSRNLIYEHPIEMCVGHIDSILVFVNPNMEFYDGNIYNDKGKSLY